MAKYTLVDLSADNAPYYMIYVEDAGSRTILHEGEDEISALQAIIKDAGLDVSEYNSIDFVKEVIEGKLPKA